MGFFSRLTNLAKGTWHAKTSSKGSGLSEAELEEELQTVRPPTPQTQHDQNTTSKRDPSEIEDDPAPQPAERDAEGNIIKTL